MLATRRLALLLPGLLAAPARGQAPPSPPADAASDGDTLDLGALMARLAAVPERRARFVEEKRLGVLDQPLRSTGRLLYRRPERLEKITESPQPESLVVDGDRLVLTQGQEAPRVVDLASQPGLRALVDAIRGPLAGDLAALRRSFALDAAGSLAAWHLVMRPADPAVARLLTAVVVSGEGDSPREVDVRQANGDEDRLLIEPLP